MTQNNNLLLLIARILMGILFFMAGLGKLGDVQGFSGYLPSGGLPTVLAWPSILFEILAGLVVIIGFQTRIASLLLAGFSVVAGVLYHFVPSDQIQMAMLFKNTGLAGGFLALIVAGPGKYSLDARGK